MQLAIAAKSGKEGHKIPVMFYFLLFLLLCLFVCSCVSIPALLVTFLKFFSRNNLVLQLIGDMIILSMAIMFS